MRTRCAIPFLLLLAVPAAAQSHRQWIVGGQTVLAAAGADRVQVTGVEARVRILDRAATTTLQIELANPCGRPLEAVLLLPVPDGAAISGFTFEGPGREATAEVLPRDEARRLYDEITARLRDPALLEFADWRCLRSSVFPVPAHGRQRLRLTYDHVLDADGGRIDYVLPRSEALALAVPWDVRIEMSTAAPLGLCYSPSHAFEFERRGPNAMVARLAATDRCEPGSLRLGFTTTVDPARPGALLFAYPDPTVGGGYFLLLAGVPAPERTAVLRREVTIVLDRSGSMAGRKLEQAKAAARQVLLALDDGEGIQVVDYGNTVSTAFPAPVAKNARTTAAALAHLEAVRPHGGTNLHDALVEALRAEPVPQTLPFVLFLTDGLPTVGPRREADLRRVAETGNPHGRRVFCFGVGHDVNVPLLDRIAETTRATTVYVTPEEDVERAVARTFARLDHPVLAGPMLRTASATPRIAEVLPPVLPDLFAGDQLVVLGQYRGEDDLEFELRGRGADGAARFRFTLPVRTATTRHAFVPRLWASRQIAFLVDELRQATGEPTATGAHDPFAAPHLRELRDEILRLSARFGVLGEYTAFLAREGSDLGDWDALATACANVLTDRAVRTRSGAAAVNQGCNLWQQKAQAQANYRNVYLDAELRPVETATVQQICDRAFFRRGDRWIDGNSVANGKVAPDERVPFASPRFFEVVRRLEREGRAGLLSLRGEILLELDGKNLLVTPGAPEHRGTDEPHPEELSPMNPIPMSVALALASALAGQAAPAVPAAASPRPIDLAICLDISGSMDGLLNAARQNLWAVVNELATLEPAPALRVALLTFGCSAHDAETGWVKLETGFTTDLDLVSQRLFELTTNGGEEYVARVVRAALDQLEWSPSPDALKLLFVAGNEAATQDPKLDVLAQCRDAIARGIVVDSIYCGDPADPIAAAWRDVALAADGRFAAIAQDQNLVVATPFDEQLVALSAAINTTYVPYGSGAAAMAENQVRQDANAASLNSAAAAQRCQTKAGGLYWNASWDLVDACADPKFDLAAVDRATLPEALRGLAVEKLRAHVEAQRAERTRLQKEADELGRRRDAFVQQELARRAADGEKVFEQAVLETVREQACGAGFARPARPEREDCDSPFVPVLRAAVQGYEKFECLTREPNWSPLRCDAPPPAAHMSRAEAGEHGRKLYLLYARSGWGYLKPGEPARAGETLVKEAWVPQRGEPTDETEASRRHGRHLTARDGDTTWHAGAAAGLFVMHKLAPETPDTDQGWVYGTIDPDGVVTSAGKVASCIRCHEHAAEDRRFGLR